MAEKTVIASWILSAILAVVFLAQAVMKFMGMEFVQEMLNEGLNVPLWAIPVIGVFELVGAVLVLIPKTRVYGAALLILVMVGAIGTHMMNADWAGLLMPMMLGVMAGIVVYLHRGELPIGEKAAGPGTKPETR